MKFRDIPKLTKSASYRVTISWSYLKDWLNDQQDSKNRTPLDIDPYFQRPLVWTRQQKINYLEYILKGGISGREIYFNCVGWSYDYKGPFYLVDGKQRINTVLEFLDNKIPAFGVLYKDFEGRLPNDVYFWFNINDLKTEKEVLNWYLEINTGGSPHTEEEIDKVKKILKTKNYGKTI